MTKLYSVTAHLILVVKYRRKVFNDEILTRLEQILKETLEKWESYLVEFNGEEDHIHCLISYPPKTSFRNMLKIKNAQNKETHSSPIKLRYDWGFLGYSGNAVKS